MRRFPFLFWMWIILTGIDLAGIMTGQLAPHVGVVMATAMAGFAAYEWQLAFVRRGGRSVEHLLAFVKQYPEVAEWRFRFDNGYTVIVTQHDTPILTPYDTPEDET